MSEVIERYIDGEITARIIIKKGGEGSGNFNHAGRPGKIGGSGPAVGVDLDDGSPMYYVMRQMKKAAEKLGFDPNMVVYGGTGYEFEVDGFQYTAGGQYNPNTGVITIYHMPEIQGRFDIIDGIISHEVKHAAFAEFFNIVNKELDDIAKRMLNYRTMQDMVDMFADSKLPYAKQYPAVATWLKYFMDASVADRLAKSDGVTEYSKRYWAEWEKDKSSTNYKRAVNETLAEIAHLKATAPHTPGETAADARALVAPRLWEALYSKVGMISGIRPTRAWNDEYR